MVLREFIYCGLFLILIVLLFTSQEVFITSNSLYLTLSFRRSLSYRNQSIDLQSKSMDWFLYDSDLRHERV